MKKALNIFILAAIFIFILLWVDYTNRNAEIIKQRRESYHGGYVWIAP